MQNLQIFELPNRETILVEIAPVSVEGPRIVSKGDKVVKEAAKTLSQSMGRLVGVAEAMKGALAAAEGNFGECELSFGITFTAEADLVVVRGSGEANATVTLRWGGAQGG